VLQGCLPRGNYLDEGPMQTHKSNSTMTRAGALTAVVNHRQWLECLRPVFKAENAVFLSNSAPQVCYLQTQRFLYLKTPDVTFLP